MANLRIKIKFLTLFIIGVFILSGCAKIKSSDKVIATVNGEPIYLKEFKRELALRVKQDPSFKISSDTFNELLEAMIDKKLIIQEAMKKRLAEKDRRKTRN